MEVDQSVIDMYHRIYLNPQGLQKIPLNKLIDDQLLVSIDGRRPDGINFILPFSAHVVVQTRLSLGHQESFISAHNLKCIRTQTSSLF